MSEVYVERRAGKFIGYSPHPIVGQDGKVLEPQEMLTEEQAKAEISAVFANRVPQEVWAGAMMRALNALDILAQVDALIAASNDLLLQKLWARAAAFRRDDPMIAAVGAAVNPPWSETDLDDLFRLAGSFN